MYGCIYVLTIIHIAIYIYMYMYASTNHDLLVISGSINMHCRKCIRALTGTINNLTSSTLDAGSVRGHYTNRY